MRWVLVHSPALGPSSWMPVAAVLRAQDVDLSVPDLRGALDAGPERFAAEVPGGPDVVVVGHSGAGAILPLVPAGRRVFVDAGVPPCTGRAPVGGDFLDQLRQLAAGEQRLPPWPAWWPTLGVEALVPDAPRVPLAFYEATVEWAAGWCDEPASYVLLSDAYREDALAAAARGWPVVELTGGHLEILNRPEAVAQALLRS